MVQLHGDNLESTSCSTTLPPIPNYEISTTDEPTAIGPLKTPSSMIGQHPVPTSSPNNRPHASPSMSRDQQKTIVDQGMKEPLLLGGFMYLISAKWLRKWERWISTNSLSEPENMQIDNQDLFQESSQIMKRNLQELVDYFMVPQSVWTMMTSWLVALTPLQTYPIGNTCFS